MRESSIRPEWLKNSGPAVTCLPLMLLLGSVAGPRAFPQEKTWGDANTPLVYSAENTGASFPAPNFPSFAQLPIIRPLPDAFRFADGSRDTSFAKWERRRNEIGAAIQKYEIGPKPDCHDSTITANYLPPASATAKGTLTIKVTRNGKTITLTEGVYIPTGSGPFPALIPMTAFARSSGPNYGSLPAAAFAGLPIATVDFVHNQVASLSFGSGNHTSDPFYQLYPELCAGVCTGTSNSGLYAAWSWGVSRVIDGMIIASHQAASPLPIDVSHLAVTGCSYAGKMAMFAGAFDERIGLTISQENGGGGAASWRVSHEIEADGSVEDIHDTSYDWFAGQMRQFAEDNGYKLPEDHHELMAMIAPRALLETGNSDYYWLSNRSNYISARATQLIYNTFGIGDRFGFYIDGGHPHCGTLPAEAPSITAFVSKFMLGSTAVNSDVEVNPYSKLDFGRWTAWWGGDPNHDPQFPADWNVGGNVVMSIKNRVNLQVNAGETVSGGYQFEVRGGTHPATTVSLTSGDVQADVLCADGSSYTLKVSLPQNQSYSIAANNDSWFPGTTEYQGSASATACGTGASHGVLEGTYFSALGLANGTGKPPKQPGLITTDMADPLDVRFSCAAGGKSTGFRTPLTVNFQQ
ncbi:MAG TPA: hypothetical protein VJU82_04065 [Acidobacteriaceae bacterium]|nr:hypothetical protein [Acidobacteriaceae bacterium]